MSRINLEAEAIAPFEAVVRRHNLSSAKGQGTSNRLPVAGNAYFQFGDLRVDLPHAHVVLEVESAGGVTNLVKYWPCIAGGLIRRPVHLLHLFRRASRDDYRSHIELWGFLSARMKSELGERFACSLFTYASPLELELRPALQHFEELLTKSAASS
jgi:hypothetical protein